ncbi:MAG: LamB/YcsF family protein [Thermoanaerobaculia bacterium]|nr:LamB/YcsF family protein [Thermoanaerobaculia bacterium]
MTSVDLSCDLGEASTPDAVATETAIWPLVTSANVACGGHAGDADSMRAAVVLARRHGVRLGAHPSFPDREGFGRRAVEISDEALVAALVAQLEELHSIAWIEGGVALERVKAHGALYNLAHHDSRLARLLTEATLAVAPGAALVCPAGSAMEHAAGERGLQVVREAFADRRYLPDGALVPRGDRRALLDDPAESAAQALSLATHAMVTADDGSELVVAHETICVHSDMPGAVERLVAIRVALARRGVGIRR